MSSVFGVLKVGEAQAILQNKGTYRLGAKLIYCIVLFVLIIASEVLGALVGEFVGQLDHMLGGSIGAVIGGAIAYAIICICLTPVRYRRRMVDSGFPLQLCLRTEITPDELVYKIGEEQHTAKWSAVTELSAVPERLAGYGGYWIFLTQSSSYFAPYFIPRRFFADGFAQRAFVNEALAHMNEAARLRSQKAVAIVVAQRFNTWSISDLFH